MSQTETASTNLDAPIPTPSVRERWLGLGFFLLMCGYSLSPFFHPRIPGWNMFVAADRYAFALHDSQDRTVRFENFLPGDAIVTREIDVVRFARWYARKHPSNAPLHGVLTRYGRQGTQQVSFVVGKGGSLDSCSVTGSDPTGTCSYISTASVR